MKTKILYVDDEAEWRRMVGLFLMLAGFEVFTAKDATTAMRQAELERPDAVILDVNLAGEDGGELIGILKANNPDAPVILYTGFDHDAEATRRLLEKGALHYLRKGNLQNLVECIEEALRQRNPAERPRARPLAHTAGWQMV
jgi:DNA-binding NtrC family response regulator